MLLMLSSSSRPKSNNANINPLESSLCSIFLQGEGMDGCRDGEGAVFKIMIIFDNNKTKGNNIVYVTVEHTLFLAFQEYNPCKAMK